MFFSDNEEQRAHNETFLSSEARRDMNTPENQKQIVCSIFIIQLLINLNAINNSDIIFTK